MHHRLRAAAAVLTVGTIGLAGCNGSRQADDAAETKAIVDQIRKQEADMLAAFAAKDTIKANSFYAPDATIMTPNANAMTGEESVKKGVAAILADPQFNIEATDARTEVAASRDLAYTRGTYKVTFTNPETKAVETQQGNYVTVFRKQADGSWKAVEDISSPGAPQVPAAAAAGTEGGG